MRAFGHTASTRCYTLLSHDSAGLKHDIQEGLSGELGSDGSLASDDVRLGDRPLLTDGSGIDLGAGGAIDPAYGLRVSSRARGKAHDQ